MKIKPYQLILLIFFTPTLLNGQYTPFVEEGKFWIYENHLNSDFPSAISGHAITFLGDTIINSFTYKKVYQLNLKGEHDCPPAQVPCWNFDYPYQTESKAITALIREDTLNKKIYNLLNSSTGEEALLFDFSLNVGDTLNNYVYESIWASTTKEFPGGIVDSIKVIETHGQLRNSIFTFGFYSIIGLPFELPIIISEGLGFTEFGIFYKPLSVFVDYCEGEIEHCNLILSNESTTLLKEIKVYPNPSNGIFRIETDEALKNIRVFSILGQVKIESKFTNKIDLSPLENGIYLLEITTDKEEIFIKKIKKEN